MRTELNGGQCNGADNGHRVDASASDGRGHNGHAQSQRFVAPPPGTNSNSGQVVCAEKPLLSRRRSTKRGQHLPTDNGQLPRASASGMGQTPVAGDGQIIGTHPTNSSEKGQLKGADGHSSVARPADGEGHFNVTDNGHYSDAFSALIEQIVQLHRMRRHAMKTQQKLDRALESLVRRNFTEWRPDGDEKSRAKANAQVKRLITDARNDEPSDPVAKLIKPWVDHTDRSRSGSDDLKRTTEKKREALVKQLPAAKWVKDSVTGAGLSGLADIIGEAGNIGKYTTVDKLYKRLGFAPYDGFAGSTWKRDNWRPRTLTKDEWIANPFSGERYGVMRSIADSLFQNQWRNPSKEKGCGVPNGPYGELYARRRAHTKITHEEWSDAHSHADALRYMFKKFLRDLHREWHKSV